MTEFWEQAFKDKQEMWGLEPTKSTVLTKDFFVEHNVKNVLIPGVVMDEMHKFLLRTE